MGGTLIGGQRAAITNKQRHGSDFYKQMGARGGKAKHTKPRGFAAMSREQVSAYGKAGGAKSRRKPAEGRSDA